MGVRFAALAGAIALASAAPALAQERDYCPQRPGLGTTPCTIAPGRVSVETGLVDWTRDDQPDTRTDTFAFARTQVRIGLDDWLELDATWLPYGRQDVRDKPARRSTATGGVGDVTLGFKANLWNPDGSGVSIAVVPFATLPVGRAPIGASDWGAGVLLPVYWDVGHGLSLQFTPEVDAAVNSSGRGRHLAYSGIIGLGFPLLKQVSATVEFQGRQDDDPGGARTQAFASVSANWNPRDNLQFDIGAVAGLNRASPSVEVYAGVSRRF